MFKKTYLICVLLLIALGESSNIELKADEEETTAISTTTEPPDYKCRDKDDNIFDNSECKEANECVGAILSGRCNYVGLVCCFDDSKPPEIEENQLITQEKFLSLFGQSTRVNSMYNWFVESIALAKISPNDPRQLAAYLAQIVDESNTFLNFESSYLDADIEYLLGNNNYEDGNRYRGRGAIYIRGRANYDAANRVQGTQGFNFGTDLLENPKKAAYPSIAFKLAAWFWSNNAYVITTNSQSEKGSLNTLADGTFHNFALLTYSLTPSLPKLRRRTLNYERIFSALNITDVFGRGQGISCGREGVTLPVCMNTHLRYEYCGCEGDLDTNTCPYGYSNEGTCRNSALIKCCTQKCSAGLDIVVIMDSSGSIGIQSFIKQKDFVKTVLSKLNVGPVGTRVALIEFSNQATILQDLSNFANLDSTNTLIDSLRYTTIAKTSNLTDALRLANDVVLQAQNGLRSNSSPAIVIVLSDGKSDNRVQALAQAQRIKARSGIKIVAFASGDSPNLDELSLIATDPNKDVYEVDNLLYGSESEILRAEMIRKWCQLKVTARIEREITSNVIRNGYKYYEIDVKNLANTFTIELRTAQGKSEIYYSFTNILPKSSEHLVNENLNTGFDIYFIDSDPRTTTPPTTTDEEDLIEGRKYNKQIQEDANNTPKESDLTIIERLYYQISKPQQTPNDILYFSVKGINDENQFQLFIHNETIGNNFNRLTFSFTLLIITTALTCWINLLL